MNLEKLFGSKTKSDILKYLVFRRQGVSIRALESELGRTFPGIKKQIDSLEESAVLHIDKTPERRSIKIMDEIYEEIRKLIISSLKYDTRLLLSQSPLPIKYYLGKLFDKPIDVDLVILYTEEKTKEEEQKDSTPEEVSEDLLDVLNFQVEMKVDNLDNLKKSITHLFKSYMIDPAYLVFMTHEEFDKRTKMADKFAMQILRSNQ